MTAPCQTDVYTKAQTILSCEQLHFCRNVLFRIHRVHPMLGQGLPADHLNTVFHALVVSRILYALPAWGVFLNAGQSGRIDVIFKLAYECAFFNKLITATELSTQSSTTLFRKIQNPPHCLSTLLPPKKYVILT